MKNASDLFVVQSANSDKLRASINQDISEINISVLKEKNDLYSDVIVFIESLPEYKEAVREILTVNPRINFILFHQGDIPASELVEFVKCGVIESACLDDQIQVKNYIERYRKTGSESQLNQYHQLINRFRQLGIITSDYKMAEIFAKIDKVIRSNSTVLIYGESGTGKELIARSIHELSERKQHRFIGVNTGAIPETLLEDELFGHVKGSFTSAVKDRKGKFEFAHGGTIFLDEISNMPSSLQVKLLRVLQERIIEKIGDNEAIPVDVRVIAATNKRLFELVEKGLFREDLYYRLNVIPIELPPIRERRNDIPILANYFVAKYCQLNNLKTKSFTMAAIRILKGYSWPGNIRQLENIIERMVVLNPEMTIFLPQNIPDEVKLDTTENQAKNFYFEEIPDEGISLSDMVREIEKKIILKSLEKTSWNKQKAARLLKIKRTTLIEKIKKIQS